MTEIADFSKSEMMIVAAARELAGTRVADHCFHYGRKPSNGSAAKVIAVRESARKNDAVGPAKIAVFMPQQDAVITADFNRMRTIAI